MTIPAWLLKQQLNWPFEEGKKAILLLASPAYRKASPPLPACRLVFLGTVLLFLCKGCGQGETESQHADTMHLGLLSLRLRPAGLPAGLWDRETHSIPVPAPWAMGCYQPHPLSVASPSVKKLSLCSPRCCARGRHRAPGSCAKQSAVWNRMGRT